jgi:ribonuclease HI
VSRVAIVHLDESCLGNGREGENPGGAGGLIEARAAGQVQRRDFYNFTPNTTNNRMALSGAITALRLLANKGNRLRVLMVSDSEYLVKGMREWAPGWASRGWIRKAGPIENLSLWQDLAATARLHEVQWTWVRGHQGHAKNEYANDLAIAAAREGKSSPGLVDSEFLPWLQAKQAKGKFAGYDPDQAFAALERRVAEGESFPLAEKV